MTSCFLHCTDPLVQQLSTAAVAPGQNTRLLNLLLMKNLRFTLFSTPYFCPIVVEFILNNLLTDVICDSVWFHSIHRREVRCSLGKCRGAKASTNAAPAGSALLPPPFTDDVKLPDEWKGLLGLSLFLRLRITSQSQIQNVFGEEKLFCFGRLRKRQIRSAK